MSAGLQLREGTPSDAAAIRDLTRAAYAKWIPAIGREPVPMTVDYAQALLVHRFDLAYHGEELAGLIETARETDCLLIENVAVSPAWQGRGLGRRLMSHAEELAHLSGYGRIRLYTNKAFVENILFYRRLGYEKDKEVPFIAGFRIDMSKKLRNVAAM
jgi:ribosomal protein S18 acetylase RimI-like enzyme